MNFGGEVISHDGGATSFWDFGDDGNHPVYRTIKNNKNVWVEIKEDA